MVCCQNRKCLLLGVFLPEIFIIIFEIVLVCFTNLYQFKDEIKDIILEESLIFNLHFSSRLPTDEYKYYKSFHDFQGRERIKKERNDDGEVIKTKRDVFYIRNISRIYQNFFIYDKDERNYFDYKNNYTVASGENCKSNYKKCGIFNNDGRILCLPNDEECPLNDFAISDIISDPNYEGYNMFEATDSITDNKKYFYYTNKKTDNKIITTFKLSHGLPCMDSNESSWISIFNDEVDKHPSCTKIIDGKTRDDRFIEIPGSKISLQSLYNDNDVKYNNLNESVLDDRVELYARNFYDKDEKCINKFFEDLDNEEKYFNKVSIVLKVLIIISVVSNFTLFIYSSLICCKGTLRFYWFFLIIPIYGMISNIISIIIIASNSLKYKCEEIGFNNKLNDILEENYSDDQIIIIIMSSLSFFFHIILLIFSICIAKIGITSNNYDNYAVGGYPVPVQMNVIPAYNPQIPPNNIGYYNPQMNAQIAPNYSPYPNQMGYNNININPPSRTPM